MVEFRTEKVTEHITRIFGICTELMYLVEGNDKAALIDTGSGFGSLKKVVSELTDKPVIVLLTHDHVDHAMGAAEFENVYMNHRDDDIFVRHGDDDFRWEGLELFADGAEVSREEYIPTGHVEDFRNLSGGDRFDLGGITVEIYDCEGHTSGSVAMLMKEERVLLLGDACNDNTFLFEDYSLTLREYHNSLLRLKKETSGKYDTVLASHGAGSLPVTILDEVIEVCEDIETGNADDVLIEFRGNKGFLAKQKDASGTRRMDGKVGNIVYNKDKIQ